jgi:hypothetical protein
MPRFAPIAAVFAALILCAAASAQSTPVGKWKGRMEMAAPPMPANATAEQRKMMEGALKMMRELRIDLTVSNNQTFSLSAKGPQMPKAQTTTGSWSRSGRTVTMTPSRSEGKEIPKAQVRPITLQLSADGKTLTANIPGSPQGSARMIFTRA